MNQNPWTSMQFTIVIPPRGQARSQSRALVGKDGMPVRSKKSGRVVVLHHKSASQKQDEAKLEALIIPYKPDVPLVGPIRFGVRAFFPVPASKPKRFREDALAGRIWPTKKPDLSNIVKHLEDVMNGVFWADDAQIVGFTDNSGKYYGEPARYEITVLYRRDDNPVKMD